MSACARGGLPAVVTKRNESRLPAAGEDPVHTSAAASLREQAAGLRRSIAVGAPVRLVVAALGQVQRAIEHASRGVDLAEYLSDERGAVDPVRERAANELVAKRRVRVRPDLDGELLEVGTYGRDHAHPRQPTNGRDKRWWTDHGDIELAARQRIAGIRSLHRESEDEPLDVGWVRSPVAGVAPEDELLAALVPLDEERATPDGSTRPRIVDSVAPDLREVRTAERVRRQDVPEESPPGREPRPQNHSHGLAIHGTRTADGGVEFTELRGTVTAYRPQREDEVLGRDRDSVAPARRRMDVVGQREWSPPREVDPRDEAFLEREVGTDLERRLQNLLDPARGRLGRSS